MDKKAAIKILKNEVDIILKEYRINYVIGLDSDEVVIACPSKSNIQFIFANLKSRYDNKKYWNFISKMIVKNDFIIRISLN